MVVVRLVGGRPVIALGGGDGGQEAGEVKADPE